MKKTLRSSTIESITDTLERCFSLTDVRLIQSSTQATSITQATEIQVQMKHGVNITNQNDSAIIRVRYTMNITTKDATPEDQPLASLLAIYQTTYAIVSRDFKEKHADFIFHVYPVMITWQFWREFVHSSLLRHGFPPVTVPMLYGNQVAEQYKTMLQEKARAIRNQGNGMKNSTIRKIS